MKARLLTALLLIFSAYMAAQPKCVSQKYNQQRSLKNTTLKGYYPYTDIVQESISTDGSTAPANTVIRIPVVIHNLYHTPAEKITDIEVAQQLQTLNDCFRKRNNDTANTPVYFKGIAADVEIEFVLATSDPRRRYTTGIVKKYTPVKAWEYSDNMKSALFMGADAWDGSKYLNIWVCNLSDYAGYSSLPGEDISKDGIVLSHSVFGANQKTLVHEAGHWLNLQHLWGDDYCGDDGVSDTPKQADYTMGCPTGVRITCTNGPTGDMYMNYMDFTSDACTNMFTKGQKNRMRALFVQGGPRNTLLSSTGLSAPLILEIPLPEEDPKWLQPAIYPIPATSAITLDISYDVRWMGKTIFISNQQGQMVMNVTITSKIQSIDITRLQPGMYFLAAKKDDGESIKQKFIKM